MQRDDRGVIMSDTRNAVEHDASSWPWAEIHRRAGLPEGSDFPPRVDDYVDTWADDYVDKWLIGRTASTQRSQNFDSWGYTVSRAYRSAQAARNVLRSMTSDGFGYSDTQHNPGLARGRARYRETHVHETLSRDRLVQEIHRLLDAQGYVEGFRTHPDPEVREELYSPAEAQRIKNDLAELLKQLFESDNIEPVNDDVSTESLTEPGATEQFSERPLSPVVELLTRTFDRAPGAPNNG